MKVLYVAVQHCDGASFRFIWTVTGGVSGSAGTARFAPFPFAMIFAFSAAPDFSTISWRPSGVRSLSLYLKPPLMLFQHGFPAHVPSGGAIERRSGCAFAEASYTQSV